MLIKKGMQVRVISGAEKGSEGKVLFVFPKKKRVVVEGVNFIKKATRPTQENQNGGIVEKEAPLHISNVMLLQSGTASKLGYKILEDGSKVFLNRNSGVTYSPENSRMLNLTGEAYFEIKKDKNHPFTVNTRELTLSVLGTSFNFSASVDEIILSPSKLTNGSLVGLLPVAIIIFFEVNNSDLSADFTSIVFESLNEPSPL